MRFRKLLISSATVGIAVLSTGCSATHHACAPGSFPGEHTQAKVTVRFVSPANDARLADWSTWSSTKLVSDSTPFNKTSGGFAADAAHDHAEHVVLWGGSYEGEDVTYSPTQLSTGSYMFGFFDPDRGAAYQGWIAINNGGDDVLSALNQWRDAVHDQEKWLAYESKINGKYTSRNADDFSDFTKQLKSLRNLEARINAAIRVETHDRARMNRVWNEALGEAEVQLMPGSVGFTQPTTRPAFLDVELAAAKNGHAVTKVILAGDFERSMEKMDRLIELRDEMKRCRAVFTEEAQRLQNRRDYYRITSHLYDHSRNFVANERQLQGVRGMIAQIDKQLNENRRSGHALMFVAGLFAPEEANAAFDREQAELRRERTVLAEQQRWYDAQFDDCSAGNEKRISIERRRQDLMAQVEEIDAQLRQIDQAKVAAGKLRDATDVIHRQGPTAVMAASMMDDQLPARLADAIERQSMMTIRIQSADGLNDQPNGVTQNWNESTRTFKTVLTSDHP